MRSSARRHRSKSKVPGIPSISRSWSGGRSCQEREATETPDLKNGATEPTEVTENTQRLRRWRRAFGSAEA